MYIDLVARIHIDIYILFKQQNFTVLGLILPHISLDNFRALLFAGILIRSIPETSKI